MDNKPKYLVNSHIPHIKILENNLNFSNQPTFGTRRVKESPRVNKQISMLEDVFIQKLDMCERKLDHYLSKTNKTERSFDHQAKTFRDLSNSESFEMNEIFGRDNSLLLLSHQKISIEKKQNNKQKYNSPSFCHHLTQLPLRSASKRVSNQKRFSYNYYIADKQNKNKSIKNIMTHLNQLFNSSKKYLNRFLNISVYHKEAIDMVNQLKPIKQQINKILKIVREEIQLINIKTSKPLIHCAAKSAKNKQDDELFQMMEILVLLFWNSSNLYHF